MTQSASLTSAPVPLVSVLMPTYNHEPYLARAIEGVVTQNTSFPFELIIGEDCSTDRTRAIALDYQQRYPEIIKVVTHEQNLGARKNSRRIHLAARGKYLAYCEGDDFWHNPLKLQKQVAFLEAHPDYALVHSNYDELEWRTGRRKPNACRGKPDLNDDNAFLEVLLYERDVLTLTVVARRDLVEQVVAQNPECTDDYWPMGDTQRWLELARLARFKYLPESLATHLILDESAAHSRNPAKVLRFRSKGRELTLHYAHKYGCSPETVARLAAETALSLIPLAYRARQPQLLSPWLADVQHYYGKVPLAARLHAWGAASPWRYYAAKPLLQALALRRRLHRLLSKSNKPSPPSCTRSV